MATSADAPRDDAGRRARILAGARARRAPGTASATFVDPYAGAVDALDRLVRRLSAERWRTRVIYDWSVHDVLAHLSATDEHIYDQLTAGGDEFAGGVLARTDAAIARERRRSPEQTRARWRSRADALLTAATAARQDLPVRDVRLGGATFSVQQALLQRAFETWIHSEDVRAAVGEPALPPPPDQLWQLANQAVELLPNLLAGSGRAGAGRTLRVVLTGAGGGEWLIALEPGADPGLPDTEMTVDVLDFCRRVGDRQRVEDVPVHVFGDEHLVHDLLGAASALAGP